MRYLPQTPEEITSMCQKIGVSEVDELFHVIPEHLQLKGLLDLPKPLSEAELTQELKSMSRQNQSVDNLASFLGGGAYHHYVPVAVTSLISRGEFMSAYTPYQPEISQGTLQSIFEFQSMMASLTGMELANASNYDGASAVAEAALMAMRVTKRSKILVSPSLHPQYRQVLETYLEGVEAVIETLAQEPESGRVQVASLKEKLDETVAGVIIQSPNAFGVVEDFETLAGITKEAGALSIAAFSEALSLSFLKSFGSMGADIVVGEGQSLGNFLNLGGPYLGIFATLKKYVRQMPGRLVGETTDAAGKRGFVLVLSTREQHIRREKATSNICTNQGLCALTTAIYLSLMGPQGMDYLAKINFSYAEFLKEALLKIPGVKLKFSGATFNEFVIELPKPASEVLARLLEAGILGGIDLGTWDKTLKNCLLVCATEMNTKAQMENYGRYLKKLL
ncbi:MAG: aminomethyl-transferring glycine dehydrogenase subunit GcvPA [Deltaproteobacteria bacterium]|nr:aminomethyl-transferring glycine dehydrogenase subunit GcvPA [Deltaproteobacteria bacterium]